MLSVINSVQRERWQEIEQLIYATLERSPEEHTAFLANVVDDTKLRAEVAKLVAAYASVDSFLEGPPAAVFSNAESLAGLSAAPHRDLEPGTAIGPYQVVEVLGAGGMGTVYLAHRADEEYDRQVAIKIIRSGAESTVLARRFRSERQILADLDHPNVARLLEGGTTGDGLPYLVMEYVDGVPIDLYCEREALSVIEIVGLLRQVCLAVGHAHRHLVVHRDLKPGNILVTADGTPKLLDFGIAKLLEPGDLPWTLEATQTGHLPMTPRYASPEQRRGEPVSTASDVYSLGLILYKLLTGQLPDRLVGGHRVRNPKPPSAAIVGIQQSSSSGARQRARELAGDLDTIVLMALREEPERRYPSGSALADDLGRYLQGLPVEARTDTLLYRTHKLMRRYPVGSLLAMLLALALFGTGVVSRFQVRRLEEQRNQAELERETAQRIGDFMVELFEVVDPSEAKGNTVTAREILDRGAERIERELGGHEALGARLMGTMGRVYSGLGLYDKALELLESSRDGLRVVEPPQPLDLADVLVQIGWLSQLHGHYEDAALAYGEARRLRENKLGPRSSEVAEVIAYQGSLAHFRRHLAEAEALYVEALAIVDETGELKSQERTDLLAGLAGIYRLQGRFERAIELNRQVLKLDRELLEPNDPNLAYSLNNVALVYRLNDPARAIPLLEEAIGITEPSLGPDHSYLATQIYNLGGILMAVGKFDDAEHQLRRALPIHEAAVGPSSPDVRDDLCKHAELLLLTGRLEEAQTPFVRCLHLVEELSGNERDLPRWTARLAEVWRVGGRLTEAENALLEAIKVADRSGWRVEAALARSALGSVRRDQGRVMEAIALFEESLDLLEGETDWKMWVVEGRVWAHHFLADLETARGNTGSARRHRDQALAAALERSRTANGIEADLVLPALALLGLDRVEEAAPLVEELIDLGYAYPLFMEICASKGLAPSVL